MPKIIFTPAQWMYRAIEAKAKREGTSNATALRRLLSTILEAPKGGNESDAEEFDDGSDYYPPSK